METGQEEHSLWFFNSKDSFDEKRGFFKVDIFKWVLKQSPWTQTYSMQGKI